MKTYFDHTQITLLICASICFITSVLFHLRQKEKIALLFLVLTGFLLFSFSALLDPFLNMWDERFHALVAKNMMHHPLMPTLYDDPILNTTYDRWDRTHVWLHKQPLFLWQITLSFSLFGISEFTLRLPMIILGSLLIMIVFRCGKLLVNARTGYIAGVLLITTNYILEVVAGRQMLDHNDFSFLFYVSASIWAFIEYSYSGKKIWIMLIGAFAGCAILCKWLVGLLVYAGWFILKLLRKEIKRSQYRDFSISLFVTAIVALPWQILTFMWYPTEAKSEQAYNTAHFFTALEGHDGSAWYHFDQINLIYGKFISILLIPAIVIFYKRMKDRNMAIALTFMVILVYVFYTMAATKMPSFTLVVGMIILLFMASLLDETIGLVETWLHNTLLKKAAFVLILIGVVLARFDIEKMQELHTLWKKDNIYTRIISNNKQVYLSLNLSENTVLFNLKGKNYIDAMFYTGLPSYPNFPSEDAYLDLKTKGKNIAVFQSATANIPEYLLNDSAVIIIPHVDEGWD